METLIRILTVSISWFLAKKIAKKISSNEKTRQRYAKIHGILFLIISLIFLFWGFISWINQIIFWIKNSFWKPQLFMISNKDPNISAANNIFNSTKYESYNHAVTWISNCNRGICLIIIALFFLWMSKLSFKASKISINPEKK